MSYLRGAGAAAAAPPDLVLEVAHGATRAVHFDELRAQLRDRYAPDLRDFFFVNTDVGAPEVARAVAARVVHSQPRRTALVVRCLLPRTFVDCNRRIDRSTPAAGSGAGELTPGLPPWIREPADRDLLLDRYFAYREVVAAAVASACDRGGSALFVHTYAPRSIDVPVDEHVVASLRDAYAANRIGTWLLRPAVDLITHDPDGRELAAVRLAQRAEHEYRAAGYDTHRNGTYSLHPMTMAHEYAVRYPDRTLCLELRRDLLLAEFKPFEEMIPEAAKVERAAAPLAAAVLQSFA
ncbi:MAG TPA: N-formylglutamate amidohydrolase [Planctomycetota bacterium]|nr:N-formylglutamate amidohydrolase [Planctomycetota bacterium]